MFRLTVLAPDMVSAILSGRNPPELTARSLMLAWRSRSPTSTAEKRSKLLIGFTVGGNYDLSVRLLARHIGRHIPIANFVGKPEDRLHAHYNRAR
jgi:hypothetical protein